MLITNFTEKGYKIIMNPETERKLTYLIAINLIMTLANAYNIKDIYLTLLKISESMLGISNVTQMIWDLIK